MEVLNSIPIELSLEAVIKRMRLRNRSDNILGQIREMLDIARPIAKPKAVFDVSYIENKNGDSMEIGGVEFTSRVLRINLDKVERVFPYVVTCGRELDEIDIPSTDFIKGYYLDQIKETAVVLARQYVEGDLKKRYALGQLSRMAPGAGAGDDWPITQQKGLFSIFGGREKVEELIGVRLTDSFLMVPIKSVSGIFFPTEVSFESCQICPREQCIGRRAAYDPEVVKKYQPEEA
ncbi:MAG: vitamin B12 dependent-methionine synthase activation domain-containing protein [Chloroflexota bacterium]|nr:vitamin B12 dependent methionine synthase [Chloroflexota bacterium]